MKITKISYIREEKLTKKTEYFILDCENHFIEVYNNLLARPRLIELEEFEADTVIEQFLTLTSQWKPYYEKLNILDGFEWRISIESKLHGRVEYKGKNELPDNFYQMKEMMEELATTEEKL